MSTPIKRLLSGSAVYGLGSVLVQLVTIILMPLLTAHLAPREYGAIALLNFTSLFLIAIFSLGLSTSIGLCYFDQKEEEWRSGVVFSAFVMLLFSGAALLACGYLTLDLWTEYLLTSREFGSAALYMLAAAALSMITFPFDTKLRLDERPVSFVSASLLSTLSIGGLTLWFVIGLALGVTGYFQALFIGRTISFFAFYLLAAPGSVKTFSPGMIRKLVLLGLPLVPQFIFLYILQYGNIEMLKRLSGLGSAGIYSAGLTVGLAINVIVSSIGSAWAPFFLSYTDRKEEAAALFARITKYYLLGIGLVTFFFYYGARPVVELLLAAEYGDAYKVVGPVASGIFMLGLFNKFLPPVYFAKQVGKITYAALAAVAFLVVSAQILIPIFGISGAAWAFFMAYIVHSFLLLAWNVAQGQRYFAIPYEWKTGAIFLSYYLASCLMLSLVAELEAAVRTALYVLHLLLSLRLFYVMLSAEERSSVKHLIRGFSWTHIRSRP